MRTPLSMVGLPGNEMTNPFSPLTKERFTRVFCRLIGELPLGMLGCVAYFETYAGHIPGHLDAMYATNPLGYRQYTLNRFNIIL